MGKESFSSWLYSELDKRSWSQSELARRAELAQPTISLVLSEQKNPGPEFCYGVARAFRLPAEVVFRRAGLLPPEPDGDSRFHAAVGTLKRLRPQDQEIIYLMIETLAQRMDDKVWRDPHLYDEAGDSA
jgi:transcriptional regulator with XRE-family HTH domain